MTDPVHVVAPNPEDVPSGGNVFNARVFDGLAAHVPAEIHFWTPGEPGPAFGLGARVLVDALLMAEVAPHVVGARERGLLVHHLSSFDPRTRGEPRARLERQLLDGYDYFVVTSEWSARALAELGAPSSRVHVVLPGLDAEYLQPCRPRPAPAAPVRVLTVGNLIERKGLIETLATLRRLPERSWSWTVAGTDRIDPGYARRFRETLAEAGVAERVRITEARSPDAMRALYDESDLLVSGARFETLGMAIREAMARELPALAWDVGGIGESIVDGDTGYLLPLGDEGTFLARLRALVENPALRLQLGTHARQRALSFPSWSEVQARFAQFLRHGGAFI